MDSEEFRMASSVTQLFHGLLKSLHLSKEGVLMYRRTITNDPGLLCKSSIKIVPQQWHESCIRKIHENIGHQGIRGTLEQAQSKQWRR